MKKGNIGTVWLLEICTDYHTGKEVPYMDIHLTSIMWKV